MTMKDTGKLRETALRQKKGKQLLCVCVCDKSLDGNDGLWFCPLSASDG